MPDALNPLDAPFGESFADYLSKGPQIGPQPLRDSIRSAPPAGQPHREPQPGEYLYQTTGQGYEHTVITIEKTTGGPWHSIDAILHHLGYATPYGHAQRLDKISPKQATLKIYNN